MGAEQSCCAKRGNDRQSDTRFISKHPAQESVRPVSHHSHGTDTARSQASTPPNESNFAIPEKVGIGAYFQRSNTDPAGLAVKSLLKGSPAARNGRIQVGDLVMAVNGEQVYGKKLAALAEVLLGPPGSTVKLEFRSEKSNANYEVVLERGMPQY